MFFLCLLTYCWVMIKCCCMSDILIPTPNKVIVYPQNPSVHQYNLLSVYAHYHKVYAHTRPRIRLFFPPHTTTSINAPTHPTIYLPIHTHTNAYTLFAYHCVHTTNHPPTSIHFPFQHARAHSSIKFYRSNSKVIAGSVYVCVRGSLALCSSLQRIYIYTHQRTSLWRFLYAAIQCPLSSRKRSYAWRKNSERRQDILRRVCAFAGNAASSCLSVCPHVSARIPLDRFTVEFDIGKLSFTKKISGTSHEGLRAIYCSRPRKFAINAFVCNNQYFHIVDSDM
jgi:hypothetical protein